MKALAVGCHPDDIEFMMSGTLMLLRDAGWEVHYINLANGSCGTDRHPVEEIVPMRRGEAIEAASFIGATYHESLVNDLEVFYEQDLIRGAAALVREVQPDVILTQSLEDYMEDHQNTARVTVTAAFCRGMFNYPSIPDRPRWSGDVMIYHATPHILSDAMRRPITPELYIDVESVLDRKKTTLAFHASQKEWLDVSQGFDSYITAMVEAGEMVGKVSAAFRYAEGWRRHSHVGFSATDGDPLGDALESFVHRSG